MRVKTSNEERYEFGTELEAEYLRLRKYEKKISEVEDDSPEIKDIIFRLVEENPNYFEDMRVDQYTEETAKIFIKSRLRDTDIHEPQQRLYYETLDGSPAIRVDYKSNAAEVIEYFDPELQLPTWLTVKAQANFVLDDVLKLLGKIDLHVSKFNMKVLNDSIRTMLTNTFRAEILSVVEENKIGYFHFGVAQTAIGDVIREALEKSAEEFGLRLVEFNLEKLLIPEQITTMVQQEYLNARILSTKAEAETRWAEASVAILEKKAQVIDKYKLDTDVLSEMEKDKALERYLKKINNTTEEKELLKLPNSFVAEFENGKVARPTSPEKPSPSKGALWCGTILFGLFSILCLSAGIFLTWYLQSFTEIHYVLFGGFAICAGLMAVCIVLLYKMRHEHRQYIQDLEVYEVDLEKYNELKVALDKQHKAYVETEEGIALL